MPFIAPFVAWLATSAIGSAILSIGVSLAIGAVAKALSRKPTAATFASQDRNITGRQPIAPRRTAYGFCGRLGGVITYMNTHGTSHEFLELVITLTGHEVEEIGNMYFDSVLVPIDGSGNATGTFAGFASVEKKLGAPGEPAFPGLMAVDANWTADHKQEGCASVHIQLIRDATHFENGIPNVTFDIKGKKLYDPRTGLTAYSPNWALCIADYITDSINGLGSDYATEIDEDLLISAANACDEVIETVSGTEARYECNGTFDTSSKPIDILKALNSAAAGSVVYSSGKWGIYPGIWREPEAETITDSMLRGPIQLQAAVSRRDSFNGVKGVYVSPENNYVPTDFPAYYQSTDRGYASDSYLVEDNDERTWKDVEYQFTSSASCAQRLSKIDLEKVRRKYTFLIPGKSLKLYKKRAPDVIKFTHPNYGWVDKTFEVIDSVLVVNEASNGAPELGVDLRVRETDSEVYDWPLTDDIPMQTALTVTIPGGFTPDSVVNFNATVTTIVPDKTASVTWDPPTSGQIALGVRMKITYFPDARPRSAYYRIVDYADTPAFLEMPFTETLIIVRGQWINNGGTGGPSSQVSLDFS